MLEGGFTSFSLRVDRLWIALFCAL